MQRTFRPTHTSNAWYCSRHRVVCKQKHQPPAQTVPPSPHTVCIQLAFAEGTYVNQDPWIVATQCVEQFLGHGRFLCSDNRHTGGRRGCLDRSVQGLLEGNIHMDRTLAVAVQAAKACCSMSDSLSSLVDLER